MMLIVNTTSDFEGEIECLFLLSQTDCEVIDSAVIASQMADCQ